MQTTITNIQIIFKAHHPAKTATHTKDIKKTIKIDKMWNEKIYYKFPET